jgi:hypothetical protein
VRFYGWQPGGEPMGLPAWRSPQSNRGARRKRIYRPVAGLAGWGYNVDVR